MMSLPRLPLTTAAMMAVLLLALGGCRASDDATADDASTELAAGAGIAGAADVEAPQDDVLDEMQEMVARTRLRMDRVTRSVRAYEAMTKIIMADTLRYDSDEEEEGEDDMSSFLQSLEHFPELERAIAAEGADPEDMMVDVYAVMRAMMAVDMVEAGADSAVLMGDLPRQHVAFVRENREELKQLMSWSLGPGAN